MFNETTLVEECMWRNFLKLIRTIINECDKECLKYFAPKVQSSVKIRANFELYIDAYYNE